MLYVTYLWLYIVYIDRLCYYRVHQSAWRRRRSPRIESVERYWIRRKSEIDYSSGLNVDVQHSPSTLTYARRTMIRSSDKNGWSRCSNDIKNNFTEKR